MTSIPDDRPATRGERARGAAKRPEAAPATGGSDARFRVPAEVRRSVGCALERKAEDVTVLDLRSVSSATDYFVIATGRSELHVRAVAEHVLDSARAEGERPEHVEGLDRGRWVLIDYIDHVVHVFQPAVREYYRLESLWGDAPAQVFEEADMK